MATGIASQMPSDFVPREVLPPMSARKINRWVIYPTRREVVGRR